MDVHRFLTLAEWGFNVPLFMCDPNKHYGRDTCVVLKKYFRRCFRFSILFKHVGQKQNRFFSDLSFNDVFNRAVSLDKDKYEIVVMEYVPIEFACYVTLRRDGSGGYVVDTGRVKEFLCYDFIEDVKMRCLIRPAQVVFTKGDFDIIQLSFWWVKHFSGVSYSKQIFYDFSIRHK